MKVLFALIFVSFLASMSNATPPPAAQFKNGNDISVKEIYGHVTYYCSDNHGNSTKSWNCYDADVSPGTSDYFVSNAPIAADKVTLTNTQADGKKKTRKMDFDSENSTTKSKINFFGLTLFHTPFLKKGINNISYAFTKGKNVVGQGSFDANVNVVSSKQCKSRTEFANDPNVCEFQSHGCDLYFWKEKDCNY